METAIATGAGIVAAAVLTFMGSYWLFVLQRRKRELGYEVLSANVLIPGPPEATPDIKLVVRNELIDPATPVKDGYSEVEQVLGFRVLLRNTGNEPLEEQTVTIDLGEPAITLSASIERQPDLGEQQILVEPQLGAGHRTRLTIPFLNPGQEIIVSLQSTNNQGRECRVSAGAAGLTYYDLERREVRRLVVWAIGVLTALALSMSATITLAALYGGGDDPEPAWAEPAEWAALGTVVASLLMGSLTLGPARWWRTLLGSRND